jgi:hypothetical protein
VKEIFTKFLKVGGCKTLFFHLMIFFLNKNTDFCWEIAKIFKIWGVRTPPFPVVATSLATSVRVGANLIVLAEDFAPQMINID